MALSDALAKMSAQAKEAEDKFHAAQTTQRAKLEEEVDKVRTATQERNTEFRARAGQTKSEVSSRWHDVQEHWDKHVQQMRSDMKQRRQLDASGAEMHAEMAEADADFAIAFATAAIEDAEYAALEAVLAREKANKM
jgi:hypothetical protein